ncbi:MAG: hypothetical protein ABII82_00880 [Verrucomicrobiota bacterium]
MSSRQPHDRPAAPWPRVLAFAGVLLVMLLGAAAQSPALHERLHHVAGIPDCHGKPHADDNHHADADARADTHACAVTLFAQGLPGLVWQAAVAPPQAAPAARHAIPCERLLPSASRHVRPPSRAPPATC